MMRHPLLAALLLLGTGCAAHTQGMHQFAMLEHLCVHCNCLMPAGIEPDAICPVCNCGKKAKECVH